MIATTRPADLPASSRRAPAYCVNRARGTAYVTIDGRQHQLGKAGSPESRALYRQLVDTWAASNRVVAQAEPLLADLMIAYLDFCRREYSASQAYSVKAMLADLATPLPSGAVPALLPVNHVTAPMVLAWRDSLVGRLCRSTINAKRLGLLRAMLKWGVVHGHCDASVVASAAAVPGIRPGRGRAAEPDPVGPVHDDLVARTLPHLPSTVAAMVQVQRLTGMRPGEICRLHAQHIDRSSDLWVYTPAVHKGLWRGKARRILIGPRAQALIAGLVERGGFLFDPSTHFSRRGPRKLPPGCRCYTPTQYARAIRRACDAHGLPRWAPNQLRHSMATQVRTGRGLEAAQVVLGHAHANVTQVYAERNQALAESVIREVG